MLIVQLSDLHIVPEGQTLYGLVDTAAALKKAIDRINQLACPPDAVLITGDLVNRGQLEEYIHLRQLLAPLCCPYYFVLGNHDDQTALKTVFPAQAAGNAVITFDDLCLILLDTHLVNQDSGQCSPETLEWLAIQLAQQHKPTLLALHHPPFATGIQLMDQIGLHAPERLEQMVAHSDQIIGLLCGHVHRAVYTTFGGKPCLIAPSPAHQIFLDLGHPSIKNTLGYTLDPAGFFVHVWQKGSPLVSHYVTTEAGSSYFYPPMPMS